MSCGSGGGGGDLEVVWGARGELLHFLAERLFVCQREEEDSALFRVAAAIRPPRESSCCSGRQFRPNELEAAGAAAEAAPVNPSAGPLARQVAGAGHPSWAGDDLFWAPPSEPQVVGAAYDQPELGRVPGSVIINVNAAHRKSSKWAH